MENPNDILVTLDELFDFVIANLNTFSDKQLEDIKFKSLAILIDRGVSKELNDKGLGADILTDVDSDLCANIK